MLPLVGGGHTNHLPQPHAWSRGLGAHGLCASCSPRCVAGAGREQGAIRGAHRGAPTELLPCPQSRSDFIGGRVEVALSLPRQEQCLSLAVLDMLRIAKEKRQSPDEVFNCVR